MYVCVFYCHNISSRIVLSSVILVFTTTMRKTLIFLSSNTLSQIAHIIFLFWGGNKMTIPLECWDIFVCCISCVTTLCLIMQSLCLVCWNQMVIIQLIDVKM